MKIFLLATLLSVSALAQSSKPATPPTITDAHKAALFKAQLQVNQAQAATQVAQAKMQAAIADLTADCGKDFQPQWDANGDPICVVKPAPPPTPTPEKK